MRHILRRQRNVQVLVAKVAGIDVDAKTVQLGSALEAQSLRYDHLRVASGATHAYSGHDDSAKHAPGLKTLDDALAIRRRVLVAFGQAEAATSEEDRRFCRNFAIVGGGPTGVELAGTLAEIAHCTLRREFRRFDPRWTSIRLIEADTALLAAFPHALQQRTKTQLESLGVEVAVRRCPASPTRATVRETASCLAGRCCGRRVWRPRPWAHCWGFLSTARGV